MIIWKVLIGAVCGGALAYGGACLAPRWLKRPPHPYAAWAAAGTGALLAGLLAAGHGLDAYFWTQSLFFGILITASLVDLHDRIIPNDLVLFGLVAGAVLLLLPAPERTWGQALGGLAAGGGGLLLLALLVRGGMGMGDVKLAAVIGLFVGLHRVWLALLLAFLAGGLFSGVLILLRRVGRKDAIPFGPFLAAGAVIAALYGEQIWAWYQSFY